MTAPRRATTEHACPHCICNWEDHIEINTLAPFYPLVELIEAAELERQKATK